MSDFERLERRLAAVERALTDSDRPVSDVPEQAAIADDIDRLDERIDDLVARVADLEGSTQALRGYVGNVRSVNEAVERRADAAVATVDRLERRIEAVEGARTDSETTMVVSRAVVRDSTTPAGRYRSESGGSGPETDPDSTTDQRAALEEFHQTDPDHSVDRSLLAGGSDRRSRPGVGVTDASSVRLADPSAIDHQQIEAELAELTAIDDEPDRRDSTEPTEDQSRRDDADESDGTAIFEAVRGLFS
ncbi:hypothetical protein HALLA_08170 [Halostagnicola larsenii XH-48]|uniref:DUF7310 domain-containing protein n=1 Tax=Halostagnicola larsenii XH-48 TaxID=797299 RepID=W0JPE1_9EURY|nr:hypothetical protein [Halostagnicola larsenii]AHF98842.1 hypothetical protein HALLA_08170 [Halostagnicola larsenii XH-48]